MKIAVIDGQGGGLGRSIVTRLKKRDGIEIIALGTNSQATSAMMKAGAHRGATGENAIAVMSQQVDAIIGPIAILVADSMMGEITEGMTRAVARSSAEKILLPINRCQVTVLGTTRYTLNDILEQIDETIDTLKTTKV